MKHRLGIAVLAAVIMADAHGAVFQPVPGAATAGGRPIAANGSIFFFGYTPDGGSKPQPWISDGTAAGTHAAKTIIGSGGQVNLAQSSFTWKGLWYFAANDGFAGYQLWRSDGTDGGTFALTSFSNMDLGSITDLQASLTGFGDQVIFNAELPSSLQLMASDGTIAGTKVLAANTFTYTLGPGAIMNGKVYYAGSATRLVSTDGTAAGTAVTPFGSTNPLGNFQSGLVAVNEVAYFAGSESTHGSELWRTDGTVANTVLIKDIYTGTTGSSPDTLIRVDDRLFFVAASSGAGRELWTSDGTAAGTVQLKDIHPGIQDGAISDVLAMNGKLYFTANDNTHGNELWVSDGTAAGTVLALGDFDSQGGVGAFDSVFATLQTNNDKLLMMMQGDGDPYAVPYTSDGTLAGTAHIDATDNNISSQQYEDTFALSNGSIYAVEFSNIVKADAFATLGNVWCSSREENIPDDNATGVASSVHLPAYGRISDLKVSVDIGHTYVGDLTVSLVHEQTGKQVYLFDEPDGGRCDGQLMNISFDDKAPTAADDECETNRPAYPNRGSFRPLQKLTAMDGQSVAGDWTLHVVDNAPSDVGTLHNWCMRFGTDSIFADEFE